MSEGVLTASRLNELIDYEPTSGRLVWKRRHASAVNADLSAGYVNDKGYISVMVDGRNYPAHRLAWFAVHGRFPGGHIDHINGDRSDNRIANLRDVSPAENQKNTKLDRRNASGVSGVRFRADRGLWEASIRVGRKLIHLGRYRLLDAAIAARKDAERLHAFHPNHGRLVAGRKAEKTTKEG